MTTPRRTAALMLCALMTWASAATAAPEDTAKQLNPLRHGLGAVRHRRVRAQDGLAFRREGRRALARCHDARLSPELLLLAALIPGFVETRVDLDRVGGLRRAGDPS